MEVAALYPLYPLVRGVGRWTADIGRRTADIGRARPTACGRQAESKK